MALQTHRVGGLQELGVVRRALNVVAGEAGDAVIVHGALHEVVALHAVLVSRAVGEVGERGLAEFVLFQLPIIAQVLAYFESDGPIVIYAVERLPERLSLRMALDASVVGGDRIEPRRVDDVGARRGGGLIAPRTVADRKSTRLNSSH